MEFKKWNSWDYDEKTLPTLVYGILVDETTRERFLKEIESFKKDRDWRLINHQTAGIACHHPQIFGIIVPTSPEFRKKMKRLSKLYYDSHLSSFMNVNLDELEEYRENLKAIFSEEQFDCNRSYSSLEEGIFPIDGEYVKNIMGEDAPDFGSIENEFTFIKHPGRLSQIMFFSNNIYWTSNHSLFILSENSD